MLLDTRVVGALASADFRHEARMSACLIIALATVLAPLLTLFGLRYGVVSTLRDELRRNPTTLELRPLTQEQFREDFFDDLRARDGVDFLIPNTRFLAGSVRLSRDQTDGGEQVHAEMVPSAPGDPLLRGLWNRPIPADGVILSQSAAEKLDVGVGDRVVGRLGRVVDDRRETVTFDLTVNAVLHVSRYQREAAFVGLEALEAAEDYREGFAVPAFSAGGRSRPSDDRTYASFRLYASTIDDVEPLRDWLAERGIDTDTHLAEIMLVKRLDRSLVTLFSIVAGLGGGGFSLSLMISLWGNVERKRYELSILRLLGMPSISLALFPTVQALLTAAAGCVVAGAIYGGVAPLINGLFSEGLGAGQVVCRLPPEGFATACLVTVALALLASSVAGFQASRYSPAEGLRHE